jgi:hypothetical protein
MALQPAATAARGAAAAALRVVVAHRPPLVFIREAENGSVSYSGMLIELLPRMLEAARINRPYQLYQLPSVGQSAREHACARPSGAEVEAACVGPPKAMAAPRGPLCRARLLRAPGPCVRPLRTSPLCHGPRPRRRFANPRDHCLEPAAGEAPQPQVSLHVCLLTPSHLPHPSPPLVGRRRLPPRQWQLERRHGRAHRAAR